MAGCRSVTKASYSTSWRQMISALEDMISVRIWERRSDHVRGVDGGMCVYSDSRLASKRHWARMFQLSIDRAGAAVVEE